VPALGADAYRSNVLAGWSQDRAVPLSARRGPDRRHPQPWDCIGRRHPRGATAA